MKTLFKRALVLTTLAAGALSAAAGPALAQTPPGGGGNVAATVSIPSTLSFTLADSAFSLTGSPGAASNVGTVHWSITTNDGAGWAVTVKAASASMAGTGSNHATIPISDVAVLPASQNLMNGWITPPSFGNWAPAQELSSSTAFTTDASSSPTSGTLAAFDYYAIPGAGTLSGGDGGQDIPSVPADSYSDTIAYVAFGN